MVTGKGNDGSMTMSLSCAYRLGEDTGKHRQTLFHFFDRQTTQDRSKPKAEARQQAPHLTAGHLSYGLWGSLHLAWV